MLMGRLTALKCLSILLVISDKWIHCKLEILFIFFSCQIVHPPNFILWRPENGSYDWSIVKLKELSWIKYFLSMKHKSTSKRRRQTHTLTHTMRQNYTRNSKRRMCLPCWELSARRWWCFHGHGFASSFCQPQPASPHSALHSYGTSEGTAFALHMIYTHPARWKGLLWEAWACLQGGVWRGSKSKVITQTSGRARAKENGLKKWMFMKWTIRPLKLRCETCVKVGHYIYIKFA